MDVEIEEKIMVFGIVSIVDIDFIERKTKKL